MKLALVLAYVLVLLGCGFISMKKTRTVNDFFLGGRGVGPWLSAFAYGTTYFSAVLFIGYAGKVGWGFGLSALWVTVGNSIIGCYLAWRLLAKRTRDMTLRLNTMTMPEFLEKRYDSPNFKIFAALLIFIFLVPYTASVYMGLSYLFETVFHIPYNYALIAIALLTAVYLTMGGYFAVALTDLVQGIIMIFGVGMLLYYITGAPEVGGFAEAVSRLAAIDPKLAGPVGPPGIIPLASLVILTSLGTWGLPQMVQKFYAIKDEKSINAATWVSTFFAIIIAFGAYFTGAVSRLFNSVLMEKGVNPALDPKYFDMVIPTILTYALPEIAVTIILLLVLSASMSTLASLVLVSSSAISIDLVQGRLAPNISKRTAVLLMRVLCVVFVAVSLGIAIMKPQIILTLMALSWGTVAGAFLAPYLYGLFWKGVTKAGAWAGALTGFAVSLGVSAYFKFDPQMLNKFSPMIGSAAMLIPLVVVPAISLVSEKFPEPHLLKVFGTKAVEEYDLTFAKGTEELVN
ncbi:SSS sodium solute transporter superfamily protein [Thermincola ferriacetica]|uniref:Sodium/proline symporter n=1 Tax=Thermincola ferriacetica TaxID=281456 RepID=A0A0L6W3V9_9FIRM|nr:sodium/proline symporter [Thermincola ferriacetica]KNZ69774.1 SSS sodium solute transporter superfamily protein [Thermincola ferriacetica]